MRISWRLVVLGGLLPLACGEVSSDGGVADGAAGARSRTPAQCDEIARQIEVYVDGNTDPLGDKSIPAGRQNNPCDNPVPTAVFSACTKLLQCKDATGR